MKANKKRIMNLIFNDEKGYVNRKDDAGGPTNWGITIATLSDWRGTRQTALDVRNLTKEEADEIYDARYWKTVRADELPSGLDYTVVDFYVNSGAWAIRILQRVLGVTEDGVIGDQTMKAIERYPGGTRALIVDYCEARMKYLRGLGGPKGFSANGRGWTIRVTGKDPKRKWADQPGVIGNALAMYSSGAVAANDSVVHTTLPTDVPIPTKAPGSAISVTEVLKHSDSLTSIATTLTGLITAIAGNNILSYAFGGVILIGGLFGVYTIVEKYRKIA